MSNSLQNTNSQPLFVDLDGTLTVTDTLWESILLFIKQTPFGLLLLILWLFKGKEQFKALLARRVIPNPALLPYRKEVLAYLQRAHEAGQPLWLATAADQRIADGVAEHFGFFSGVLATNGRGNLAGKRKLQAIREKSVGKPFSYIGDAAVDLPVWQEASTAVMVNPEQGWVDQLSGATRVETIASRPERGALYNWMKALRVHQWSKNLLLLLPMLMAHRLTELNLYVNILTAFLAFSFCASAVYILNDLLDLESDRVHPTKKYRPFAAGTLSIPAGFIGMLVSLFLGLSLSLFFLPDLFVLAVFLYLLLTTAYSLYLKRRPVLDILTLAGLYTFRIMAGAIAVSVAVSSWLLAFSMFFFLSLALMKRYTDLLHLDEKANQAIAGRGFHRSDLDLVRSLGISCGYLAVLVFVLYISSDHVNKLYNQTAFLWLIAPLLLYWITRMWLMTHRGKMDHDPIVFTLKDRNSYFIGLLIAIILALAMFTNHLTFLNRLLLIP